MVNATDPATMGSTVVGARSIISGAADKLCCIGYQLIISSRSYLMVNADVRNSLFKTLFLADPADIPVK
jgi:hypothetical protein